MKTIIFVCHGNICRSPAAEWLMKYKLLRLGLEDKFNVFSRATSIEEIGNDIYPLMKRELYNRSIPFFEHHAKRITQEEYESADYIFYMDLLNKKYLSNLIVDHKNILFPINVFSPEIEMIDDPWYTGKFAKTLDQIDHCLDDIISNLYRK